MNSRPRVPGRGRKWIAYPALLGTTALGTLSANMINAPLYVIQGDLQMTTQQSVLAVSAFTVAMATVVPLAGWLCDRVGTRALLIAALGFMVIAEVIAAWAPGMEVLIAARAAQGAACSAIPPCVLAALMDGWPERSATTMGAWASAIGLGQAIGPPFGGFVTEALGWRSVFLLHALLVLAMMVLLAVSLPRIVRARPPAHTAAMVCLVVTGGTAATAIALAGQGGVWLAAVLLMLWAAGSWAMFIYLCRRRLKPGSMVTGALRPLLDPALLKDGRYLLAAAGAGLAMAALAVFIVAVPLFLAAGPGMGPAGIGLVVLSLAAAMMVSGPVGARIGVARGTRAQLKLGVLLLIAAGLMLTAAMVLSYRGTPPAVLVSIVVPGLALSGAGIAFTQSAAATELVSSPAGRSGTAMGIHNMLRFLAMALGYSAVSLAYVHDVPVLVFPAICLTGLAMLAALQFGRRGPAPAT